VKFSMADRTISDCDYALIARDDETSEPPRSTS